MKLGFFVTNQYLPGESMPRKIQDSIEQVQAAREAGFDLICTGQHYLAAPYQMSASFPLLARLAAEAGDMEVAATVILVPLHNPVELDANYLIFRMNWPGMAHQQVLRQIELIGSEVIPRIKG